MSRRVLQPLLFCAKGTASKSSKSSCPTKSNYLLNNIGSKNIHQNAPLKEFNVLAFEEIVGNPKFDAGHAAPASSSSPRTRTALVMHGLLGSGRNWRSWTKRLADSAAAASGDRWRLLLVDLRCHGSSSRRPGLPPPHNLQSAAGDVLKLLEAEGLAEGPDGVTAILGHSFGGKVAIELLRKLQSESRPVPPQVWVLDSQPGRLSPEQDASTGVSRVLETVHSIPVPVPSRQWLTEHLATLNFTPALSMWLASNLVPAGGNANANGNGNGNGGLRWAFDGQGAAALYMSYRITDSWPVLERPPRGASVFLVTGDRSDRWPSENLAQLSRAKELQMQRDSDNASSPANSVTGDEAVHSGRRCGPEASGTFRHLVLENAGHWVHVDNPTGLLKMVLPHLLLAARAPEPAAVPAK